MAAPIYYGGKPFSNAPMRQRMQVIASSSAAQTITKSQSNAIFLFDRVSMIYTLPAPKAGLFYIFVSTVTAATNQEVDTNTGTVFMQGALSIASSGTRGDFTGNGTSHVKFQLNGTTKGGIIGSIVYAYCLSSTIWQIDGQLNGSGVAATPFA